MRTAFLKRRIPPARAGRQRCFLQYGVRAPATPIEYLFAENNPVSRRVQSLLDQVRKTMLKGEVHLIADWIAVGFPIDPKEPEDM
jgi:hypothetical protein